MRVVRDPFHLQSKPQVKFKSSSTDYSCEELQRCVHVKIHTGPTGVSPPSPLGAGGPGGPGLPRLPFRPSFPFGPFSP